MKISCVLSYPNPSQIEKLGSGFYRNQAFHITVGKEYLVLGLHFEVEPSSIGEGIWVEHLTDYGNLVRSPLALFKITDGRVSRHWEARIHEDNSLTMWPASFYREYYHDDLSEGITEVEADFQRVYAMLKAEFDEELP